MVAGPSALTTAFWHRGRGDAAGRAPVGDPAHYCTRLAGESAGRIANRSLICDVALGTSVGSRLSSARVIGSIAARSNATVSVTGLRVRRSISPAVPKL